MLKLSQNIRDEKGEFHDKSPILPRRKPQSPAASITLRRHSVVGNTFQQPDFQHALQHRSSSKEVHSLQKYKPARETSKRQFKPQLCKVVEAGGFLNKEAYRYMNMIGKGGFGKVWKVEHRDTQGIFALKEISKAIVITKRSVESIINERQLLSWLRHRFLVNMIYAFQDKSSLYIVMSLMEGGDLRYHLSKMTSFSELETKFMAASIILALEYLHSKMIIHRDVKPENIVFDHHGYAYLTDMGIAKKLRADNSDDTSGTPGYMAPEVMFHQPHRFEVDHYALGVVIYEIMMGRRPYAGKSRNEIKAKIKERQAFISKKEIPEGWTIEAADFVNKLLQRKPVQRLGWAGIEQVKQHTWLRNFPWLDLLSGKLSSPMKRHYNHMEVRYKPTQNDTSYLQLLEKNKMMLVHGSMQDYFEGYTYEDVASTSEQTRS